jgi:hypothetical protein
MTGPISGLQTSASGDMSVPRAVFAPEWLGELTAARDLLRLALERLEQGITAASEEIVNGRPAVRPPRHAMPSVGPRGPRHSAPAPETTTGRVVSSDLRIRRLRLRSDRAHARAVKRLSRANDDPEPDVG